MARGDTTQRLRVSFGAVIAGDSMVLDRWDSDYMLIPDPPATIPESGRELDAYLRRELRATLQGASITAYRDTAAPVPWASLDAETVESACSMDERVCLASVVQVPLRRPTADDPGAFDTLRADAILRDLLTGGRLELQYRYGYESRVSRVWSPLARRFYLTFSCC